MKILLSIASLLLLLSCESPRKKSARERKDHGVIHGISDDHFYVIVVDNCEYVVYHSWEKGGIIHKANCKNHNE